MSDTPRFEGLWPGMAEWWITHIDEPPLVVIRCGRGEPKCTKAIGEVKDPGDGREPLAMSKNEHPEVPTEWFPVAAPTAEEARAELEELEGQILRTSGVVGDGKLIFRRTSWPSDVAPVDLLNPYYCKEHGEIAVDREDLAAFVRDTRKPKRTYWAHLA